MQAPDTSRSRFPLSPARLVNALDERIIGQHTAKHKLAGAMWWNSHRRLLIASGVEPLAILPRQNVLLAGPSGTGKTLLVRTAAGLLDVPFFATPATSYSRVGYVGLNPEDMIAGLLLSAGGDVTRAERGIILLDEVDKLRKRDFGGQDDVGGDPVQQMLLMLLDGVTVQVKRPGSDEKVQVDTSGITFVAAGAFAGLEDVVLRRLHRGHDIDDAVLDEEIYRHLAADDLIDFGLIPEFVARFAVRAGLVPLTREQLRRLLRDAPTSPLRQAIQLFRLHGVELVVEDEAIEMFLDHAQTEKTGARALLEVLNDRLLHVVNSLPELVEDGVTRVIIDADTVARQTAPWKIAAEPLDGVVNLEELAKLAETPAASTGAQRWISNVKGWSEERIRQQLNAVKGSIGWETTTGSARKWWDAFERENSHKLAMVLRLAEELALRNASIPEFFLAYVYSNTDNIQANLHYLDYKRLKTEEERRKKQVAVKAAQAAHKRFATGQTVPAGAEGQFSFDGYVDGSSEPPLDAELREIKLEANQPFPAVGPQSRPCFWKRSLGTQESEVRSQESGVKDQPEENS